MPRIRTVDELEGLGSGSRVLLRLDLNVPLTDGKVADDTRIKMSAPTVYKLVASGAVVALLTHLGRPKGHPVPELSTKVLLKPLAKALEMKVRGGVRFVAECVGPQVDEAVREASPGDVLLLENVRFHPEETKNDRAFAELLAKPLSHYVNDAFGTMHRAHASTHAVATLFPPGRKGIGRLVEAELRAFNNILEQPQRPFVAVVGGAKVSTKVAPLKKLAGAADHLLLGGGMANTFIAARGFSVGRSLVERDMLEVASEVEKIAEASGCQVHLPTDFVVTDSLSQPGRSEVVPADSVPGWGMAADVGPETLREWVQIISDAASVFWNGPVGVFEVAGFEIGTLEIAKAVASRPFSLVGGGESVMAVHRAGVANKISHVSTGGGAALELLASGTLPALKVLEET